MIKRLVIFLLVFGYNQLFAAPHCVVQDPELQLSYSGDCVDGQAHGRGVATGLHGAFYQGRFENGAAMAMGLNSMPMAMPMPANGRAAIGRVLGSMNMASARPGVGINTWGTGIAINAMVRAPICFIPLWNPLSPNGIRAHPRPRPAH